jgi:CRP-like cAMP-binding protein
MKTTERQGKDQFTEPNEHKTSAAIAIFNPASSHLLTLIAQQPFFKGLSEHLVQLLADSAMEMQFKPGDWIYRQGDPANRFYLIQHGKVVLESRGKETTAAPFEIIGDGDVLGWSWLFPPFYSHFEARALEPTQSVFLYGTRLREKCEQYHELGYALMKRTVAVVIQRLQATRGRLLEISALRDVGATDAGLLATDVKKSVGVPE